MLYELLAGSRERILALARAKAALKPKPGEAASTKRLVEAYGRLLRDLGRESEVDKGGRGRSEPSLTRHGRVRGAGGDPSQVAYAYSILWQAIIETAQARHAEISLGELRVLGRSLSLAISDAAADQDRERPAVGLDEATRIGFLIHELRNALSCVFVAHALIKKVPEDEAAGAHALLEKNLQHMRLMLDRAYAEVRQHKDPQPYRRLMPAIEAVQEVEYAAREEARRKGVALSVRVDPRLMVDADDQYLVSSLGNLVQNAVKFTKPGGTVWVRSREVHDSVVLEVEDRCGGLPEGKIDELFEPFTQKGEDRSGLGLGLAISRRAAAFNDGSLSARDIPGKGCVFSLTLPRPRSSALAVPAGRHKSYG